MGKEIERKFLVKDCSYKQATEGILYRQGYLSSNYCCVVRVRVAGGKGYLTVKSPSLGAVRDEYEYEIPLGDANEMINGLCEKPVIEKHRYRVDYHGLTWEVDEFLGVNEGLVVAEVELSDENQEISMPPWVGKEVTGNPEYRNSNLVKRPFTTW